MAASGNLSRAVRTEAEQEVEGRYRHVKADAIEKHRFGRTIRGTCVPHLHLPTADRRLLVLMTFSVEPCGSILGAMPKQVAASLCGNRA
jgi:hypothetical protein